MEEKTVYIGTAKLTRLGKGKPGKFKRLVKRHLGDKAAEKITKSDGAALVAKGKKTGNTDLVRKGSFIKNMMREKYEAAINDIDINTRHRNETIEKNGYGPANPDNPGNFWKDKADLWNIDEKTAKTMKCGNCAAFDQTKKTLKKIADAIGPDGQKVVEHGNLGYCELFEFKCAGTRTCDAWVHGGPIKEEIGFPDDGWGTNKSVKKMKKKTPGEQVVKEAQADLSKTRQLARAGLIDKKDLSRFEVIMRKLERSQGDTSRLTMQERNFLASIYDDLLAAVIKDPSIFMRMKQKAKKGELGEESIEEKKLTKAEMKKREEVARAIERDNPDMPMAKKMAIATATAKRVAEDSHVDGEMTKKTLKLAADAAMELDGMIGEDDDLPEWVQSKITKAADYLDSARDYMKNKGDDGKAPVGEDIERTADVRMVKVKLPDGRVVMRRQKKEIKVGDTAPQSEALRRPGKSTGYGLYKSPAHAKLQKFMDKQKQNQDSWNKLAQKANEEACCEDCDDNFDHIEEQATIIVEGEKKDVTLNKPFRTPDGPKKFAVYVKNEKGNVVKVTFGDPNLSIKRDDPVRRKSFRARHNCDNPGPKTKARYWSCYQWRAGAKVED